MCSEIMFVTWKRPKNLSGRNIVKIKDLFQKSHENFPKNNVCIYITVHFFNIEGRVQRVC